MIKKTFALIAIILSLLATPLKADEDESTKTIFISDIHMCDYSSIVPPDKKYSCYGWFNKNSKLLTKFLENVEKDRDVKNIVILGDLFDGWVCPYDEDPLHGAKNVDDMFIKMGSVDEQTNPINAPVIKGFQQLALDGRLIYVPGNHDMRR